MLTKSDLESPMAALESLIESFEELGYRHLLGAEPAEVERTVQREKALAKVVRALEKARRDLEALSEICD